MRGPTIHSPEVKDLWRCPDYGHLPLAVHSVPEVDDKGQHPLCCPYYQPPVIQV